MKSGESRLGVVGIVIKERENSVAKVQHILSEHSEIIVGRLGLPYKERGLHVIALIVDGDTDSIGSLTGKLGMLPHVKVKTALTKE